MSKRKRDVSDVIDIGYLQLVQDSIGRLTGITTALLDRQGVPISKPTNLNAFCAMMQASETGVSMCIRTNEQLIAINLATRKTAVLTCPVSGLRTAAIPFFLGNEYLGSWLIGQIRMAEIDLELIRKTSQTAGLSEAEAMANMAMLPVINEQEFENILNFFETSTKIVTDLLESNAKLMVRTSELEVAAEKLNNSVRSFQDFLDMTDVGVYLTDFHSDEPIMSNYHFADHIAKSESFWREYPIIDKHRLIDQNGEPRGVEQAELFSAWEQRWFHLRSRATDWIDGRKALMTTVVDITERKQEEQRIEYLAYHDRKLGIPNGLKLREDLAKHPAGGMYLICFALVDLREINNVYGRNVGDRLLRTIVTWIKALPEPDMNIYRIKGNEFAVFVKNRTDEQAKAVADHIFKRFNRAWNIDMGGIKQTVYSGAHIGVMQVNAVPESDESFLNLMERVMKMAARAEMPVIFDEEKDKAYQENVQLRVSLKACVLNHMEGFSLNYQPVVDAATGRWVGMEALCRWNSPELGPVSPDIFIGHAEQLGLISAVSGWVFGQAIAQVKAWGLERLSKFHHLSVNVSPIQLRDRELPDKVLRLLETYDFPAGKLILEVTETAEVKFDVHTLQLLKRMQDAGVSLALDDFGIGYASFSNLNSLPINMLKTDRSFLAGIEDNEMQKKTMRFMIEYAHAAGIAVIVEGVETEEQGEIIKNSGANLIQGYYFCRPLTGETLSELIDKFR